MKGETRIIIIMICLFVSGLIGGYLINEITVLQEYGSQCVEQCNAYMEHNNCIPWKQESPTFKFNITAGDIYD